MRKLIACALVTFGLWGCQASQKQRYEWALKSAGRAEASADPQAALQHYEEARRNAQTEEELAEIDYQLAHYRCRGGEPAQKVALMMAVARAHPKTRAAPRALLDAAHFEESRDSAAAIAIYERIVIEYPSSLVAETALRRALADLREPAGCSERGRAWLSTIAKPLREALLFTLVECERQSAPEMAVAAATQLSAEFPLPGGRFTDEGLFLGAQVAVALDRPEDALKLLASLREAGGPAAIVGSYDRATYVQAYLLSALIARDLAHDPQTAKRWLEEMLGRFPESRLADDALLELARTQLQLGLGDAACQTAKKLADSERKSRHRECARAFCTRAPLPADCSPERLTARAFAP